MEDKLELLAQCVERGKADRMSPYPPDLKDQDGASEISKQALESGTSPEHILEGCMLGMQRIGDKFSQNKAFVPELLMAAKAMNTCMNHLQPYFEKGEVKKKGTFIIGTVEGDLHDVGKNLVSMVAKGGSWNIVDLGVDVSTEKFMEAVEKYPQGVVGLSALLTTTMINMQQTVQALRAKNPLIKIIIGGAPVSREFAEEIGADAYSSNPQGGLKYLDSLAVIK